MRGLWRPMATYGAAAVALTALVFIPTDGVTLRQAVLVGFTVVPFQVFMTVRGIRPGTRFLRGLEDAGVRYAIVRDEIDWRGERRMHVHAKEGDWFLLTRNGRNVELHVRGPNLPRRAHFRGDWRRAGKLVARVHETPWKRTGG